MSIDRLAAPLIIAVALHVHHALEVVILEVDLHEDPVSKTVDLEVRPVEICWDWWQGGYGTCDRKHARTVDEEKMILTASGERVSNISFDTFADAAMTGGCTVSIGAARPFYTWISASIICELTVLGVKAVIVQLTLQDRDAVAVWSKLHIWWADTPGSIL